MNSNYFKLGLLFLIIGISSCHNRQGAIDLQKGNIQFMEVEEVAHRLINQDPALLLVDVRNEQVFEEASLPDAMNLTFEGQSIREAIKELDDTRFDIVFFSADDKLAQESWQLSKELRFKNSYILKGGLPAWETNILSPEPPPVTASANELEQFQFRKAASLYFSGQSVAFEPTPYVPPVVKRAKKTVKLKPKKKVVEEEEGC